MWRLWIILALCLFTLTSCKSGVDYHVRTTLHISGSLNLKTEWNVKWAAFTKRSSTHSQTHSSPAGALLHGRVNLLILFSEPGRQETIGSFNQKEYLDLWEMFVMVLSDWVMFTRSLYLNNTMTRHLQASRQDVMLANVSNHTYEVDMEQVCYIMVTLYDY